MATGGGITNTPYGGGMLTNDPAKINQPITLGQQPTSQTGSGLQSGMPFNPPTTMTNPGIGSWYNQNASAGAPQNAPTYYDPSSMQSGANGGFNYGDYNDPYNAYLASIPVMQQQMQMNIGDAMAAAGGTGTRYGSAALERAGQIGAQAGLQQNQMLNELMFQQSNRDLDRQFNLIPLQMQMGQMIEQGSQDRLGALAGYGQWEQGRADDMANRYYQDFEKNKYGLLPMLLEAAMSQGAGSPGSPGSIAQIMTNPGSAPDIDPAWITGLIDLFT